MLQKVTKQIKRKLTDTDEEQVEEVDVGALAYKSDDESVTDAFANLRDCVASDSEWDERTRGLYSYNLNEITCNLELVLVLLDSDGEAVFEILKTGVYWFSCVQT